MIRYCVDHYLTPPYTWSAVVVKSRKLENIDTTLEFQLMPQRHEAAEGSSLTTSIAIYYKYWTLSRSFCHLQRLKINLFDEVKHSREWGTLLGPISTLYYQNIPHNIICLSTKE